MTEHMKPGIHAASPGGVDAPASITDYLLANKKYLPAAAGGLVLIVLAFTVASQASVINAANDRGAMISGDSGLIAGAAKAVPSLQSVQQPQLTGVMGDQSLPQMSGAPGAMYMVAQPSVNGYRLKTLVNH